MDIIVGLVRKEGQEDEMTPDDNETITQLRLRYEEASGKKETEKPRLSAYPETSLYDNEPSSALIQQESDDSSSDDASESGETQVKPLKPQLGDALKFKTERVRERYEIRVLKTLKQKRVDALMLVWLTFFC